MNINQRLNRILAGLPEGVKLVAVSKFHPAERLQEAYDAGQRIFGENRPQEMTAKYELLPKDIEWHMIGHLQTNKVKYIAPFVSMISSVDSERLIEEIEKQAAKNNRIIDILLEVHVADEAVARQGSGGMAGCKGAAVNGQGQGGTEIHIGKDLAVPLGQRLGIGVEGELGGIGLRGEADAVA